MPEENQCLCIYLPIYPSMNLSIYLSIYVIYLSIYPLPWHLIQYTHADGTGCVNREQNTRREIHGKKEENIKNFWYTKEPLDVMKKVGTKMAENMFLYLWCDLQVSILLESFLLILQQKLGNTRLRQMRLTGQSDLTLIRNISDRDEIFGISEITRN